MDFGIDQAMRFELHGQWEEASAIACGIGKAAKGCSESGMALGRGMGFVSSSPSASAKPKKGKQTKEVAE